MDFVKKKSETENPNPLAKAGYISQLLILWIMPLLRKGGKQKLDLEDMYDVLEEDEAGLLGNQLENIWDKHKLESKAKGQEPQLLKCMIIIHGKYYFFLGCLTVFNECVIKVLQPVFLRWLIQSFYDDSNSTQLEQYLYASGLCATILTYSLLIHTIYFQFIRIGLKCKIALSVLVYRKALRLSKYSLRETTTGHVVNLLSTDVTRFDWNLFPPYLIAGPLQLAIFGYLLWREINVSAFAGIGIVTVLLPMQYFVFKYSEKIRMQTSARTDARSSFMSEIIVAIRVIKMYAWEKPFSNLIHNLRELEVKYLTRLAYLQSFYHILFNSAAKIIVLITIITFTMMDAGNTLTADSIFFCVAVINTLLHASLFCVPMAAADIGAIFVSMRRLQKYFLLEEYKLNDEKCYSESVTSVNNNSNLDVEKTHGAGAITMNEVNASWTSKELTLKNLNVNLSGNQLVMIVGSVGAGKSSFLNALISELPITSGSFSINGKVAYDSQDPWLFSATVKQNILFGREYDHDRYHQIINVCGLEDDLKQFPHGNSTVVGERGVSLSGGQKARLNLARSLYQKADIYLLDDPLSAVDTHVSRHIFDKCIKTYLDGSLRILVTHQLQYLPNADYIIVLKDGEILAQGSYKFLLTQNVDFMSLMSIDDEENQKRKESLMAMTKEQTKYAEAQDKEPEFLEEQMAGGHVTYKTYFEYFKASKSLLRSILILLGLILTRVIVSLSEYWLAYWIREEEQNQLEFGESNYDRNFYLHVFIGLIVGTTIFGIVSTLGFFKYCMGIGINMHNNMFASIVRAPTKFFDFNPSGRIMNRFTRDLVTIDEMLPETLYDMTTIFFEILGIVVIVCITNYIILIPTFFIVIVLLWTRNFFIGAGRAVKRIEALSRSPVFTHLTASMQGISTIRSSNSQTLLNTQFESYQNRNTSSTFLFISTTRWFGVWLELESVIYLIAVTFSFFILPSSASSGNIGLAISSALVLNLNFQWGMRQSAETENNMVSVERIAEYSAITSEAPLDSKPDNKPSEDWPAFGEIKFNSVSLSYNDSDGENNYVLKNLTFDVKSQEKIGIIGRTGAGKSSVVSALFRMTEPGGTIYIDGICINHIGLHDLRKSISIIPQDPVLFSGTARYNLDPFDKFVDSELWMALEEVHLKEAIPSLDFIVTDSGGNLSVGQRQLICLARAILRKNRIIVMDEATANVDPRTDELIQKTIRSKFLTCTIITIAHRLNSVIDCDRILVLDNGCLMEYGHPYILLQNPEGHLTSMVRQIGHHGNILHQIALKTYNQKMGMGTISSKPGDNNGNNND